MWNDNRRKVITEEHITIIKEPDSVYVGHVTPQSGSASHISKSLITFLLEDRNFDINGLVAIGCDGTNCNTGRKGGIIRLIEEHFQKPLQWLICLLHANELPLRHLIQHLDGKTSGPNAFLGPIGKALSDCEKLPIIKFKIIEADIPVILKDELSTDQLYLFDICSAIVSGFLPTSLAKREPGKIVHSRWLTTANRILRLYVGTTDPSTNLVVLATFIMKVYAPTWFSIKINSSCKDGAKNLFKLISSTQYLEKFEKSHRSSNSAQ